MKRLVALLMCMIALSACTSKEPVKVNPEVGGDFERFTMKLENIDRYTEFYIITDHETGIQYLYVYGTNGRSGITQLEVE